MASSLASIQDKLQRVRPIPFQAFLTIDGTPSGDFNIDADHSVTPQDYWFDVGVNPGAMTIISGIDVMLSSLVAPPATTDYGEIVGGLTNGFDFWYDRTSTGRVSVTNLIQTNLDLSMQVGDMVVQEWDPTFSGVPTTLHFRGNSLLFGAGIPLPEGDDSLFGITANDDFSAPSPFDAHIIQVRGFFFDNPEQWVT